MVIRFLLLPLLVKSQKNMVHMNNHQPEMQRYQLKTFEAKTREESENIFLKPMKLNQPMIV